MGNLYSEYRKGILKRESAKELNYDPSTNTIRYGKQSHPVILKERDWDGLRCMDLKERVDEKWFGGSFCLSDNIEKWTVSRYEYLGEKLRKCPQENDNPPYNTLPVITLYHREYKYDHWTEYRNVGEVPKDSRSFVHWHDEYIYRR